jgi:hypothetical protein
MNNDVYDKIKRLTIEEFANILNTFVANKKDNPKEDCKSDENDKKSKILYNIDELIENYPFFTRYSINKAIQNDGLPYLVIGKKRLFDKDAIDNWLSNENKNKINKKNNL